MTFIDAVNFFNSINATRFPQGTLPFSIEDHGIGEDSEAFKFKVYAMAKKGSIVVIDSFNDGNNEWEVLLDVKSNKVTRIGFGAFEYTLEQAIEKGVIKLQQIVDYLEADKVGAVCVKYIRRLVK